MSAKIEGVDRLVRRLGILSDSVAREHLIAAAMEGAELIRAGAAERAPKDTGRLAESMLAEPWAERSNAHRAVVRIGPDKDHYYGLYVEFGHAVKFGRSARVVGHVPPHPFLRPALDENRRKVRAVIAGALKRRLGL